MTQFGMYSTMTPRNDASPARGQWNLADAYRYISEAYGGYHCDALNGINIDAGIFMSYVGLFSYYNFDNWTYQPSYVSSNTPWFFNGMRIQIFPTDKLKIEPWIDQRLAVVRQVQRAPGVGAQILWRPNGAVSIAVERLLRGTTRSALRSAGASTPTTVSRSSTYDDRPKRLRQGGVLAHRRRRLRERRRRQLRRRQPSNPRRTSSASWSTTGSGSHHDHFGLTMGGGAINNPGRYLVLLPPINGATAFSGTPYFTRIRATSSRPGTLSLTFDYMPNQFITFRFEFNHRAANVPYFAGAGGVTPVGGNQGAPGRSSPDSPRTCASETRLNFALLVKF